jgi:UPF0716 protein FxsA
MLLRLAIGLALIVVPMLELMLLIRIGQTIGVWPTLALVVGTGVVGALIISRQSVGVLIRTLEALSEGRPPVEPVLDGLFLMLAGGLLLMPGLATDVVALLLLVPPLRRLIARASVRWMLHRTRAHREAHGRSGSQTGRAGPGRDGWRRPDPAKDGPVIDVEWERIDERPVERPRDDRRGKDA